MRHDTERKKRGWARAQRAFSLSVAFLSLRTRTRRMRAGLFLTYDGGRVHPWGGWGFYCVIHGWWVPGRGLVLDEVMTDGLHLLISDCDFG